MSMRLAFLKPFLAVFVLNGLLAFPIAYQSYKQYDVHVAAWDVNEYMGMVERGSAQSVLPFRFRLLSSWVVSALRPLPGYDIAVDFTTDPALKRDFFHFVVFTSFLSVLVSALLFIHLRRKVSAGYAWMGSMLYLFSFYTISCGFIPMADAACHLAILSGVMAFERRRPFVLGLICLAGAFAKETSVIVLISWIAAHGLFERRKLWVLLAVVPALTLYLILNWCFPGPLEYNYYRPGFMITNVFAVFHPSAYGVTGFFHVILAQLTLLAAGAAWLWMRLRGGSFAGMRVAYGDPALLLIPFLWWLGMTMDLWTNAGRFIFMAFPAIVLFEVRVVREIVERLGIARSDR